MTTNSTWAALRNPAFRKLWIAAVISGTCVAAHDSAATWMMNIFTGSPLLLSLMSTVASLPFFLFTLPAGALADKVDRQKLVCTVQYLNNVLEQDHRAIKRRVRGSQHFRSFWGAWRTIAGYEAIHMIRKGQACSNAAGAKVGLLHHFILGLFAATS